MANRRQLKSNQWQTGTNKLYLIHQSSVFVSGTIHCSDQQPVFILFYFLETLISGKPAPTSFILLFFGNFNQWQTGANKFFLIPFFANFEFIINTRLIYDGIKPLLKPAPTSFILFINQVCLSVALYTALTSNQSYLISIFGKL